VSRRVLVTAALLLAGCATTPEGRLRHALVTRRLLLDDPATPVQRERLGLLHD